MEVLSRIFQEAQITCWLASYQLKRQWKETGTDKRQLLLKQQSERKLGTFRSRTKSYSLKTQEFHIIFTSIRPIAEKNPIVTVEHYQENLTHINSISTLDNSMIHKKTPYENRLIHRCS